MVVSVRNGIAPRKAVAVTWPAVGMPRDTVRMCRPVMEVPHAVRVARPGVRVTARRINDNLDFTRVSAAGCAGSGCNAGTARSNSAARASRRIASCCYHLAGRRFHGHALLLARDLLSAARAGRCAAGTACAGRVRAGPAARRGSSRRAARCCARLVGAEGFHLP